MLKKEPLEKMRLNKFIALCGICSRRDAEQYISQGRVCINGKVATQPTPLVSGNEVITVDGKQIQEVKEAKVWVFYKPAGLVTTHKDEQHRTTVFEYIKKQGLLERVISIGRLDLNSEGLLLLTNNSEFARLAESPKTGWKRIYRVRVYGNITAIDIKKLKQGITIDGIHYREISIEPEKDFNNKGKNAWLRIILTEGKNREIRKIMEHYGLQVNRLIRIAYGPYKLENLCQGEWKQVDIKSFSQPN